MRVHAVDLTLEAFRLRVRDAQRLIMQRLLAGRRREIGAEIEQVVLDTAEHGVELGIRAGVEAGETDAGIGLVDGAERLDAQVVLAAPLAGDEAGRAVVAGAQCRSCSV